MTVSIYKQSGDDLIQGSLNTLQNKIFNSEIKQQVNPEQAEYETFKKSTSSALTFYEWKQRRELHNA